MSDSFWKKKIFQDFPSNLDMSENYYIKMIILLKFCSGKRVSVIFYHICVYNGMLFFISSKHGTNKLPVPQCVEIDTVGTH